MVDVYVYTYFCLRLFRGLARGYLVHQASYVNILTVRPITEFYFYSYFSFGGSRGDGVLSDGQSEC